MLDAVTRTIVTHLEAHTADLNMAGAASWVAVEGVHDDANLILGRLNVCLYSIEEQTHLRNQPPVHTDAGYVRAPLWLRLHYLMVFVDTDQDETQKRLGRVLQVFHSHPRFGPSDMDPDLVGKVDHLAIRLYNPAPEEQNHIWGGMKRAMRIALYYEVDVAPIEPLSPQPQPEIRSARTDYALHRVPS